MPNLRLDRWYTVIVMLGAAALSGCSSTLTMPDTRPAPGSAEPVAAPSTNARRPLQASPGSEMTRVVDTALEMVGTPYRYGGSTPAGFDCSGLVHYAYRVAGISVPRTTEEQHDTARGIALPEARPGDLLFFRIKSKSDHVAIFIDGDRFVHAPSSGKRVSLGALTDPYWAGSFSGARRLDRL
jgi:cell wall-associated NlpC family hydrolase